MSLSFKSIFKKITKTTIIFIISSIILFFILNFIFPLRTSTTYSQLIVARDSTVMHAFLTPDDKWRMKIELHEMMPELKKTILYKEDNYFYYHIGVNPISIIKALFKNTIRGKKISGASTITMQVARLLEPKKRTYGSKAIELFRALQLELYYSKNEILQMYFNLIPYGSNIEGVKSASLLFYGKLPNKLSIAEIAVLCIVPNRPTSLALGKNNELIRIERDKWLKQFKADGLFPNDYIEDAIQEPVELHRLPPPRLAPHFCNRLHQKFPNQELISTTIDLTLQDKIEAITYRFIKKWKNYGIYNTSILILDNKDRSILAYLGSPDFLDKENQGEVDGVRAVRSPGSTLKPLAYALAFDQGIITPKQVISDVPTDFAGYAPENFNKKFNGKVTAKKALATSLNIPAVKLVDAVGLPYFLKKLKAAHFQHIAENEKNLGLSVILGGCGSTLEELTNLYVSFANKGIYKPIRWTTLADTTVWQQPDTIFSEQAAYVITDILTTLTRPDLPNDYQNNYHIPKVAWKTGTSYGRHDAWSIGFNKKYTVGVWVGNFSGQGVKYLTGSEIATPLLFDIFNTIDYNSDSSWFFPPSNLPFRLVCEENGLIPNTFCEHQVTDYYLPLISTSQVCDHLKYIWVSADEKISYCSHCLPSAGYKKKLYPNISPELIPFYNAEKISYTKIPPHYSQCTHVFEENAPTITSPSHAKEYFIEKGEATELILSCQVEDRVKKIYWFINDKFYRAVSPQEKLFFKPQIGFVKISCSDDLGRNSDITIKVSYQ